MKYIGNCNTNLNIFQSWSSSHSSPLFVLSPLIHPPFPSQISFFLFLPTFFLLFILLCSLRFLFVFFLFSSSKSRDYGIQLLNKSSIGIILEGRDGPRYTHSCISSYKVWTGYESHTNMSFCFDNRMIYLKFFPKN